MQLEKFCQLTKCTNWSNELLSITTFFYYICLSADKMNQPGQWISVTSHPFLLYLFFSRWNVQIVKNVKIKTSLAASCNILHKINIFKNKLKTHLFNCNNTNTRKWLLYKDTNEQLFTGTSTLQLLFIIIFRYLCWGGSCWSCMYCQVEALNTVSSSSFY